MTPFLQQFGKSCLCRPTLSVWEKVCLYRGIWRILLGAVNQYPKRWRAVVAAFIEQSPHKSGQKQSADLQVLHLTMFDHKRDLVMKKFRPVFVIELSDTDMTLCHKACALLLEWFLVASWGISLFRWMCSLLQLPILKCFLGLNRIPITCLRCETTYHTWWYCRCNCQLYHWSTFLWWNC